ncbi:MAG: sulfatase-like hydrolase/transferase [Sedimentisphaerales bacterium]|nr:sulfatase-like hydrolase/transferase [Sedimentisphaerales bacterium]
MNTSISRRKFLQRLGFGAAVLGIGKSLPAVSRLPRTNDRPNIVLIMADDLGYECLGCYGGKSYKTPVLDSLAAAGVRFEHCYSQPLCTPSRVKIMTGKSNAGNYTRFGALNPAEKTFGHLMQQAGYATCIVGKWQLAARDGGKGTYPAQAGFDEHCLWQTDDRGSRYRNPIIVENGRKRQDLRDKYGPDVFCEYAVDFIQRKKDNPFFLWFPMTLTHAPFEPTPDTEEWKKSVGKANKKHFADMVAYMDKIIGRILAKLDQLSLRENTLIIFTGDNGTPRAISSKMKDGSVIQGGKGLTTDAGTHVPLIANWIGKTPPGKVCSDLVDFSDILPTIAEAADASIDWKIDGRTFLPQILGKPGRPRQWIYTWYRRDPGTTLYRFARDKRWKLYDAGRHERAGKLFDLSTDVLEKNPIDPAQAGKEAAAAMKKLRAALNSMAAG